MQLIVLSCILAVALAAPGYDRYDAPRRSDSYEVVEILRDDREQTPNAYAFEFESADGISRAESGDRLDDVEYNPVGQQGGYSFTFPNGEEFSLKFVANENGFQPESAWLPVAPEFPHPIPQFVIDQIEKARREDAEAARSPSRSYGYNSDEK